MVDALAGLVLSTNQVGSWDISGLVENKGGWGKGAASINIQLGVYTQGMKRRGEGGGISVRDIGAKGRDRERER